MTIRSPDFIGEILSPQCHIIITLLCAWKQLVSISFSVKVGALCMEHMVTEACDSPRAQLLKPCSLIQYLNPAHPYWDSPLLSVVVLNNLPVSPTYF